MFSVKCSEDEGSEFVSPVLWNLKPENYFPEGNQMSINFSEDNGEVLKEFVR